MFFVPSNTNEKKIDVILMYFIRRNFDGWKIYVILMYFFRSNFDWRKVTVFSMYYFDAILMDWKLKQLWPADSNIYTSMEN